MAENTVGLVGLVFAGLSMGFQIDAGYSNDGKSIPSSNVTADTDSSMQYAAGDMPNIGKLTGTLLIDPAALAELEALIGTTGLLTLSYNISTGSTDTSKGDRVGQAIFEFANETHRTQEAVLAACSFQWVTAPTVSDQAV